ncbi:MAG: DNA-directed RNA polymerase subunit beta' [Alphaproteobacteria bacterium]|nr:DNA-directed RNA polymerase subunit beta' [Alphaproteobacteria bacterium]MBN2779987.1 DNA-directed RNA polymerase subunit beta' [Alphaproteobacteria bacterium]
MAKNIQKVFGQLEVKEPFNSIKLSIASPDQMRSWSYGEVKRAETINYRTFKPEKGGLFCAKIFGPVTDYECSCGKYKRMKYRGVVCEKCGVEVASAKVRRERMGHIELAAPCAHIWFFRSLPSRIGVLLDIPVKKLEQVLYFESYLVVEPGLTSLQLYDLITEEQYQDLVEEHGEDAFRVGIGAEALKEALSGLDLEEERKILRQELKETKSEARKKKIIRRLKIIEGFIDSKSRPEWMVLDILPVIPPDLRPLVPLDGGRFATADLNDLYRRVINRNNRLKRLLELKAPRIIIQNEKRMLQESVDALFDNSQKANPVLARNKTPYKSLADMLKGKQGRFRQNLLGKRVDYSGRSVIVSGPTLKLHQCGLPKKMALELFKPFVYAKLEEYGHANTIKTSKKMVEMELPVVWDILEEVIFQHPVLLNRAPTLHKLGIQAFEPKLIEGKAIQLHPLVCKAFNADFDGDQMAVHVPLSVEAQLEARALMMPSNNILLPANGKPILELSQDMVLGIYYLSVERDGEPGEGSIFGSMAEIEFALDNGDVTLHTKIKGRFIKEDGNGNVVKETVDTTVGRMIISTVLPIDPKVEYSWINQELRKKDISKLIGKVHEICGDKKAVIFCDKIKDLGFKYATKSGVSFGKDDMMIPDAKKEIVSDTQKQVEEFNEQYQSGLITRKEKYNKVTDAWSDCTNKITDTMMKGMSEVKPGEQPNSVYMMQYSGARGSRDQIKQLAGMRGLMAKPSGAIIETPVISNFKEGLSVFEFFTSTHGSRKGLTDTALKTAEAGYMTRKLVDVAQNVTITEEDCGTEEGIHLVAIIDGSTVVQSLAERIASRVAAEDIEHPTLGEVIVKRGDLITEEMALKIEHTGIEKVFVRSVLTCGCTHGVCSTCYGEDLARRRIVDQGEAVGIIAAQSIGEPGTQLTLRTFHAGGVAQKGFEANAIFSAYEGKTVLENVKTIVGEEGQDIVLSRSGVLKIVDEKGKERGKYKLPYGATIFAKEGDVIERGDKVLQSDPYSWPIIAEKGGRVRFVDLVEHVSFENVSDESTGLSSKTVKDWRLSIKGKNLRPHLIIEDEKGNPVMLSSGEIASYIVSVGAVLSVENGQEIKPGTIMAKLIRDSGGTKDITGGLPRVSELFEARNPKDAAIMVEKDGIVEFSSEIKAKNIVRVVSEDDEIIEYPVPKDKHLIVQPGDFVRKGDFLVEGTRSPADVLRILGKEELADYLIQEIQSVYRLQGVEINDKHFEVIVRQMLKKREVTHAGDTTFLVGEQVDMIDLKEENEKTIAMNGRPAETQPVLQGITRSSVQTHSFISAASFQQVVQVLTTAAVEGKEDKLIGLKENVIVGRLIPAGTGHYVKRMTEIAKEQDAALEAEDAEPVIAEDTALLERMQTEE